MAEGFDERATSQARDGLDWWEAAQDTSWIDRYDRLAEELAYEERGRQNR